MELYLDTANVAEVERLARIFPIAGVTTNPSIIAASKESIWEVLPRLQKAIGDEGILFAQTMSRDAQGMVKEAKHLRDAIPGIVVKIAEERRHYYAGNRSVQRRARITGGAGWSQIRCSIR